MIDKKEIGRIALLSKIDISGENEKYYEDMQLIIEMMGRVGEIDLSMNECPPDMELTNTLREDIVKPSLPRRSVLENAPEVEAGCISVPKTLGKED